MKKLLLSSLTLLAVTAATPVIQADGDHAKHQLDGYFAVATALFKDDLEAAKKAASKISEHEDDALAESAAQVAEAEDIAGARAAFTDLSAKAIELADGVENHFYTVMHCPMVKDNKGDWLSADDKVNNPYMGARMPHCGGPKK